MTFEEKAAELQQKWRTKYEQSSIKDFYKFYRINQVEIYNDFEELDILYRVERMSSNEIYY